MILPSAQVAPISDKHNRDDQRCEGTAQGHHRTAATAFPLFQENPYESRTQEIPMESA